MITGKRHSGINRALWRERHPLALVAVLLVLLPALMAPVLAASAPAGVFGICSATGLVAKPNVPGQGGHGPHDGLACCGTLCAHATAVVADAGAARGFARVGHRFTHHLPRALMREAFFSGSSRSIRAPPVAVA